MYLLDLARPTITHADAGSWQGMVQNRFRCLLMHGSMRWACGILDFVRMASNAPKVKGATVHEMCDCVASPVVS